MLYGEVAFSRVRKIAENDFSLLHVCLPFLMDQFGFQWTDSCDIWYVFFENLSRKFRFHENVTRITGAVLEDQYTFLKSYLVQFSFD
jgi:hypothetical protein